MIELRSDQDISATPLLLFTGGSNISKFGLILAFEALQFRDKAMNLKAEDDVESSDDSPIQSSYMVQVTPPTLRTDGSLTADRKTWHEKCVESPRPRNAPRTKNISEVVSQADL